MLYIMLLRKYFLGGARVKCGPLFPEIIFCTPEELARPEIVHSYAHKMR